MYPMVREGSGRVTDDGGNRKAGLPGVRVCGSHGTRSEITFSFSLS